jgi:hypothetical protein
LAWWVGGFAAVGCFFVSFCFGERGAAGAWLSFPVPVSFSFGWVFWGRTQVELGVIGGGVDEDG